MKVVVLSYNHPELTARTLKSVQALVSDSKILLVHNGSLTQHQKRLQDEFPTIEHLVLPENRHYSGGANAGLRHVFEKQNQSDSDWILFLTNDCQLLNWRQPTGAPAMIAPLIYARKEGRVDSLGGRFDAHLAHLSHCKSESEFSSAIRPYIPGTAFWIHRQVFKMTEGFDETLQTYWEDVDLSQRVRTLGFELRTDPETQVLHAIGKTCHKDTHYTTYLYQRNRKRVSLKYADPKWPVYGVLWKSWITTTARMTKLRQWDRLKLLSRAIRD